MFYQKKTCSLKTQTEIAKKQYQGLEKAFISNKDNKI